MYYRSPPCGGSTPGSLRDNSQSAYPRIDDVGCAEEADRSHSRKLSGQVTIIVHRCRVPQ